MTPPGSLVSRRRVTEPWTMSMIAAGAMVVAGIVAIAMGWAGAADEPLVPFQVPFVLSGAIGGLALVATGLVLGTVQVERSVDATEQARLDALAYDAARLLRSREEG